jgi:hypothetical protein
MSSRSYSYLAAAVLFFAAVGMVQAQGPITAKIPFDFVASGKTLPAGTYIFRDALPNSETQLAILDGHGHGAMASATALDSSETGSRLVFRKYGESYFLADIFSPTGRLHFAASRAEAKLAQTASAQSIPIPVGD